MFMEVGFIKVNIFDVVMGVIFKMLLNYINYIVEMKIDDVFEVMKWLKLIL